MRIVTRPDFDGVVCAVLLAEAVDTDGQIQWIQPADIQHGSFKVQSGDIVANLPFDPHCALWFDHHVSNAVAEYFEGMFRIAPSAARLVHEYFQDQLGHRFDELVGQADKIDSGDLTLEEILHPEDHPYILISMATAFGHSKDGAFCNHLVALLRKNTIAAVLNDPLVARRCQAVIKSNRDYESFLRKHTTLKGNVSITDFRNFSQPPDGNRFLVYSLFPQSYANIKLFQEGEETAVKLGHSIFNRTCRVNVGKLMAVYGGGGHRGAGACRLAPFLAEAKINEIIQVLVDNHEDG